MKASEQRPRIDVKRATYAVVIDPRLAAQVDALVDTGLFRSRSHGFEEGLRLLLTYHRDRLPKADEVAP